MIGKGKAISHTKESIKYGWNQDKDAAIVFKQHLAGDSPKEITDEFKIIQSMKEICKRNTISFVLSPTIEDGEKLNNTHLHAIVSEFIKDLKFDEHQAIAFVHNDKNHKHVHLYINRIDFKGNAYKDNFIGKRAQKAAERIAEKLELKTVKQIRDERLEKVKDIRGFIKEKHEYCFKKLNPKTSLDYINQMRQLNINVIPVSNKSNELIGFRYEYKNTNLKGSEVHRSLSINKLRPQFKEEKNKKNYEKNRRSSSITG